MRNQFSKRKFVYCSTSETEVPVEHGDGCCEFYNEATNRCEYVKYSHRTSIKRISEREELYHEFSSRDDEMEDFEHKNSQD